MKKTLAYLVLLFCFLLSSTVLADRRNNSRQAIEQRTQPFGQVKVNEANTPTPPPPPSPTKKEAPGSETMTGETVYLKHCTVCHANGIAGAPKSRNAQAWKNVVTKGMPTLLQHVTEGYNAMPRMGTCLECSPEDLRSAILYMVPDELEATLQ